MDMRVLEEMIMLQPKYDLGSSMILCVGLIHDQIHVQRHQEDLVANQWGTQGNLNSYYHSDLSRVMANNQTEMKYSRYDTLEYTRHITHGCLDTGINDTRK